MKISVYISAALGVLALGPFFAAEADESAAVPAAPTGPVLDEVIVSAQRRDQKLQDVPIAVSVMSEDALRNLSADSFVDVARMIPGVSFSQFGPGRQKVAIRGINANTGGATVAYYIDDAPLPTTHGTVSYTQTDLRTFDVARIEVLRGPQGTLYGARALGGAIRIIPNRPDSTRFEALVEGSGSVTNDGGPGYSLNAMVNLPLAEDSLAGRVVAYVRNVDGFVDRRAPVSDRRFTAPDAVPGTSSLIYGEEDIGDEDTVGLRAALEWTPTSWLTVRPSIMFQEMKLDGFQDITGGASNPGEDLVQVFMADVAEPSREEWTLSNLTAEADLGWANLISSSSVFDRENVFVEEATAELEQDGFFLDNGPIIPHSIEEGTTDHSFVQEIRLASASAPDSRVAWLTGLFYSDLDSGRYITETLPGYNAVYQPLGGPLVPNDNFYTQVRQPTMETERAVFGQVEWRVLDPLTLTAGIRYYDIENGAPLGGVTSTGIYGATVTPEPEPAFSQKFTGEQYRFNAAWNFGADRLLYVQAAQGFRPGFSRAGQPAFVNNPLCRPQLEELGLLPFPNKVDSDELWNYEIGLKSRVLDDSTVVNLALFRIDWDKIPQSLFLECGQSFTANAGSALSEGVEVEVTSTLTDQLSVNFSASYIDATLQEDAPQFGAVAGDRIQEVPKWQAAVSASYWFRVMDQFDGAFHLDAQYTGESRFDFDTQNPESEKGDITLVNARIDFAVEPYTISLFAKNIFNQIERQGLQKSLSVPISGRPRYVVNRPATFGVSATRKF